MSWGNRGRIIQLLGKGGTDNKHEKASETIKEKKLLKNINDFLESQEMLLKNCSVENIEAQSEEIQICI